MIICFLLRLTVDSMSEGFFIDHINAQIEKIEQIITDSIIHEPYQFKQPYKLFFERYFTNQNNLPILNTLEIEQNIQIIYTEIEHLEKKLNEKKKEFITLEVDNEITINDIEKDIELISQKKKKKFFCKIFR